MAAFSISQRQLLCLGILLYPYLMNGTTLVSGSSAPGIHQHTTTTLSRREDMDGEPQNDKDESQKPRQLTLRLFLVRHGETEANIRREVVGQSDSPLTRFGIEQAKALGRSSRWGTQQVTNFWRIYSSDLQRARHTAQLLLQSLYQHRQSNDDDNENEASSVISAASDLYNPDHPIVSKVRFEPRLREISKGAREQYPKTFTYEEALAERAKRILSGLNEPIPPLESEDDGIRRAKRWLEEVIRDAVHDYLETVAQEEDPTTTEVTVPSRYAVLAVAHSGLYRAFLQYLLSPERIRAHSDATYDKHDGRFAVPNTSLTILDLLVDVDQDFEDDTNDEPTVSTEVSKVKAIDIVLLTSIHHYSDVKVPTEAKSIREMAVETDSFPRM